MVMQVAHNIKQRDRKLAGWQTNQDASTVLSSRANALLECDQGGCRNQNAVGTVTGSFSRLLPGHRPFSSGCSSVSKGLSHGAREDAPYRKSDSASDPSKN